MIRKLFFAVVLAAIAVPAQAEMMLEFDNFGVSGGTIEYDGAGGTLVGTDIRFDSIEAVNTPSNAGNTAYIENGVLNFETGANIAEGPAEWTFATGGYFTLTGTVKNSLTDDVISTGTILSGVFAGLSPEASLSVIGPISLMTFDGFGRDRKNNDMLDFFGILPDSGFVFASTQVSGEVEVDNDTGAFTVIVDDADIINVVVPEPGSLAAFGIGACCMGFVFGRRRRNG